MFTTEAPIAALPSIFRYWLPQYCRPCAVTGCPSSAATVPPSPMVPLESSLMRTQKAASLLPKRVLLNGALLPPQCWYLMFHGTYVYLGTYLCNVLPSSEFSFLVSPQYTHVRTIFNTVQYYTILYFFLFHFLIIYP